MTNAIQRFRLQGPVRSQVERQIIERVRRVVNLRLLRMVDDAVFWRVAYWIERYQLFGPTP